jgi:hypothetical protein
VLLFAMQHGQFDLSSSLYSLTQGGAQPAEIIFIRSAAPTPHTRPALTSCVFYYIIAAAAAVARDFYPGWN